MSASDFMRTYVYLVNFLQKIMYPLRVRSKSPKFSASLKIKSFLFSRLNMKRHKKKILRSLLLMRTPIMELQTCKLNLASVAQ